MHTHRTRDAHARWAAMQWFDASRRLTLLARGAVLSRHRHARQMNGPLYIGATIVLLPRWDREVAAECVQRYRVYGWTAVPTMIQTFSRTRISASTTSPASAGLSGGGAAMPAAVAQAPGKHRSHLLRGLRADRDHCCHAHQSSQPRRNSSASVSRSSMSIRASSTRTLRNCRPGRSARSSRTDRRSFRATGTSPSRRRRCSSKSTASAFFAPATSAGSTRTAISSWSTA